jgi:hypothetical protein
MSGTARFQSATRSTKSSAAAAARAVPAVTQRHTGALRVISGRGLGTVSSARMESRPARQTSHSFRWASMRRCSSADSSPSWYCSSFSQEIG